MGGQNNLIDTGSIFNSILGGTNNKICSTHTYSAILGGLNNVVKHNCAAVFGSGITTVADNTLHVSCINANAIPIYGSGPVGTIVYIASGSTIPPGAKALYIM